MATAATGLPGKVSAENQQARLVCAGVGTLVLPWWPDEVDHSGFAAGYAETERPGRSVLLTRSSDPLPSLRIPFTLQSGSRLESMQPWLDAVRILAAAKPVVQLFLGASDRGVYRVVEAGATEMDWAPNGEPSVVDVVLQLRAASDAAIPVGPIKKKPKPRR